MEETLSRTQWRVIDAAFPNGLRLDTFFDFMQKHFGQTIIHIDRNANHYNIIVDSDLSTMRSGYWDTLEKALGIIYWEVYVNSQRG